MKLSRFITSALVAAALVVGPAAAAGGGKKPHSPKEGWTFQGGTNTFFGKFDKESVQRGYQVYSQVCANCHSMDLMSFRNLGEKGGPYYDPLYPNATENPAVKAFAAEKIVQDGPNEEGDMFDRPARPSDSFVNPWPNEAIAKAANGGALPPDLSVIVKARAGGADYIYSLLTGYPSFDDFQYDENGDAYLEIEDEYHEGHTNKLIQPVGLYYNPYFPGDTSANFDGDPRHVPYGGYLAMSAPLLEGIVEYQDGTEATVENMARDVTTFLAWASDPKQTARKETGLAVMAYLLILAILLWFSYKRIWRNVDH